MSKKRNRRRKKSRGVFFLKPFRKGFKKNFKKKIIRNYSDEKHDFETLLERYSLSRNFPQKLEQEAKIIYQNYQKTKDKIFQKRVDLRQKYIITIDGQYAKDFDDAISVEETKNGYLLGVHIADVSFFINEKTALEKEAYLRGNSFYLLDKVLPMLPEKISNVLCSLQQDEERLTLSCFMEISKQGDLIDYRFERSVIKSHQRYTYGEVEEIINQLSLAIKKSLSKQQQNFFSSAWQLAKALRQKRTEEGSILFQSREFECSLKDNQVFSVKQKQNLNSENLIEEFMLIANQCAAKFLKKNKVNTLFRIHPKASEKKIIFFKKMVIDQKLTFDSKKPSKLKNKYQFFLEQIFTKNFKKNFDKNFDKNSAQHGDFLPSIYHSLLLNSMTKAEYSISSSIHYGLGFKDYCHFTSPIRRYPDLIVHRGIVSILEGRDFKKTSRKEATWLSSRETHAVSCEREYFKLKVLRYLKKKYLKKNFSDTPMTVCIKMIYPDAVFVEDIFYGVYGELQGDFHNYIFDTTRYLDQNDKVVYQLGMVLKVFIKEIDLVNLKIVYQLDLNFTKKNNF